MYDRDNYTVIGLQHYDDMIYELFTLRQNNSFLNRENEQLVREIEQVKGQIQHLQAQLDVEYEDVGDEDDEEEEK